MSRNAIARSSLKICFDGTCPSRILQNKQSAMGAMGRMIADALLRVAGRPLEVRSSVDRADAIVVLGAPVRKSGTLSAVTEERVLAGVALWHKDMAPLLVFTGRNEAEPMACRARALGVPEAALRLEREARNTSENALFTAQMLGDSARRVIVVSQPFHLRRAVLWFRRVGLAADGCYLPSSVQFRDPGRGLRWVLKEYSSLGRDLFFTRRAGHRD